MPRHKCEADAGQQLLSQRRALKRRHRRTEGRAEGRWLEMSVECPGLMRSEARAKWSQVGYIFPKEGIKILCDDCDSSRRKLSMARAMEWGASTSDCLEGAGPEFAEVIEQALNETCKMKPQQQRHRVPQAICHLNVEEKLLDFGADARAKRAEPLGQGRSYP